MFGRNGARRKVNLMSYSTRMATWVLVFGAVGSAQAGSIVANYSIDLIQSVSMSIGGTAYSFNAARMVGTRTGGTTALLPPAPYGFTAFCAEVGENIHPGSQTHPNVTPLLGSSTATGGITGPISFDAARTDRMERLWGSFFPGLMGNQAATAAFQLAHWEIAFDNDLSLSSGYFQSSDPVSGMAQSFLSGVASGSAATRQKLVLLSGPGIQDQVAPVPEPGTIAALAVGLGSFLRRRRRA